LLLNFIIICINFLHNIYVVTSHTAQKHPVTTLQCNVADIAKDVDDIAKDFFAILL